MILQFFKRPLEIIKKVFEKCSISKEKEQNFLLVLSKKNIENIKTTVTKRLFEYCAYKEKKSRKTTTFKMW